MANKRISDEELADIMRRVENAKPNGEGAGELALVDVPKLVAEVNRLSWEVMSKEMIAYGKDVEIRKLSDKLREIETTVLEAIRNV